MVIQQQSISPAEDYFNGFVLGVIKGSVQQSHFGSGLAFWHFYLQIEMQIRAQMRMTVLPHLKPIWNTSKLNFDMQIEMNLYIFLSVQQLRQISANCHTETQIEIGDGIV